MLLYITSNNHKIESAKNHLEKFGIEIEVGAVKLQEIQSLDIEEVAVDKAKKAFEIIKNPLFVNDSGWYIEALNGFPGPFMSYINGWFSPEDFLNLVKPYRDKKVVLKQIIVYIDSKNLKIFSHDAEGVFLENVQGEGRSSDRVISLSGDGVSLAQKHKMGNFKIESEEELWKEYGGWLKSNYLV